MDDSRILANRETGGGEDGINIAEIYGLSKYYDKHQALKDVELSIKEGSLYGLLGPNGSGKSTLIHIISGLMGFESGQCQLLGKDIKYYKKQIQREIGLVPQEYALYEDLKAYENVMLFARLYGMPYKEAQAACEKALKRVDLWEERSRFPSQFSGGMKRRLNIACALVHTPKLLIMDEPTASLDPVSRDYLIKNIKAINEEGCTILYTSHYLDEIEELCDELTILNKGKVMASGPINHVRSLMPYTHQIVLTTEGIAPRLLREFKDPVTLSRDSKKIQIVCNTPAVLLEKLLPYLTSRGIQVIDIEVNRMSLEEVFLKAICLTSKEHNKK